MPAGGYTKNEEERRHLARGRPRTGAWITRAQGDPPPHTGEGAPDGPAGGGGGARLPGAALPRLLLNSMQIFSMFHKV